MLAAPSAPTPVCCRGGRSRSRSRVFRCHASLEEGAPLQGDDDDAAPPLLTGDWRSFRAKLVASEAASDEPQAMPDEASVSTAKAATASTRSHSLVGDWAHPLPEAETGCVLVANPSLFHNSQTYFNRSVLFIFDHDSRGSSGLILSKPTTHKIGSLPGCDRLKPVFEESPLFMGGDVGPPILHVLHAEHSSIKSGTKIVPGLCMGGFEESVAAVLRGDVPAGQFKFFLRQCGWGPGQLQSEVAAGVWFVAAASSSLVLGNRSGDLWAQTMALMGGSYAAIAAELGRKKGDEPVE